MKGIILVFVFFKICECKNKIHHDPNSLKNALEAEGNRDGYSNLKKLRLLQPESKFLKLQNIIKLNLIKNI